MQKSKKKKDEKKVKEGSINSRSKIFAIVLILFVLGIATGAIAYTITNPTVEPVVKNITPLEPTNQSTTPETTITPIEGYSKISLGRLDFFVKNDCWEKYKNGDYFDSYYGGKDYHTDFDRQAPWEKGPINNSQIVTTKEINGTYESFWLEISNIGDPSLVDSLDYENNETPKNISIESIEVDGRNITIIHTGENFNSQSIGPNATIACFEYDKKSIFMMWEGQSIDMYIIESFFKLN